MNWARARRIVLGLDLGATVPALRERAWLRLHQQVWIGYEAAQERLRRERASAWRRDDATEVLRKAIKRAKRKKISPRAPTQIHEVTRTSDCTKI